MDNIYLSDKIQLDTDDLNEKILKYRVINIISGVGSGKTSWVRQLANTQHDGKYFNILFLTSRRIVVDAEKNKSENARYWMDFAELIKRDKGIGKGAQRLIYCTNSKIENYLQTKYNPEDFKTHLWNYFDFIILDEAHSLAMDATYTTIPFLIERFIKYSIKCNPNCHLIMLTGTPEPIKDWLFRDKIKRNAFYVEYNLFDECRHVEPEKVFFDTYKHAEKRLIELLNNGQKVIYFASTLKRIQEIRELVIKNCSINDKEIEFDFSPDTPSKTNFVFSADEIEKKKALHDELAKNELLPESTKLFISTSIDREGVNIRNTDIHFMFAESTTRAELKQMVGRVRDDNSDMLIKEYYVVYDKGHNVFEGNDKSEITGVLCSHINKGYAEWINKYPGRKDEFITYVHKKFPDLRYDLLKEQQFLLYKGRINGLRQQREDYELLHNSINEWDDILSLSRDALNKWFPYSKVELLSTEETVSERRAVIKEQVRSYMIQHNFFDGPISNAEVCDFMAFICSIVYEQEEGKLTIKAPRKGRFGKNLKELCEFEADSTHRAKEKRSWAFTDMSIEG